MAAAWFASDILASPSSDAAIQYNFSQIMGDVRAADSLAKKLAAPASWKGVLRRQPNIP
jgi:hypothetical protein